MPKQGFPLLLWRSSARSALVDRRRPVKRLGLADAQTMELINESIEISPGCVSV
jgi:hypothetical protein